MTSLNTDRGHKQVLAVSVMPDQTLGLEWEDTRRKIPPEQSRAWEEIYDDFSSRAKSWLYHAGFKEIPTQLSPSLDYFIRFSRCFVEALLKMPELETLRHGAVVASPFGTIAEFMSARPMMAGAEYVTREMLQGLWQGFNASFADEITAFEGRVSEYLRTQNPDLHPAGRVFFHLVENKNQAQPFAFMATYSTGIGANGKPKHLPLKHAIETHDDSALLTLLSTVYKAGESSALVAALIESGELFHPLAWDEDDAFQFLKEIPDYEASGVICRIPDWWKQSSAQTRVNISLGDQKPSLAGLDAILDFKAVHSGKFRQLGRICETIFNHPGIVLHGSVSVAKRKKLIQTFQDETYCPFMVLSLKAGGVGLNLTRANHVVHFDRWWNPAVENQATDRAFRIGQTRKVLVHKFVTRGTIEEKIDIMISAKQDLADQVVAPSGEVLVTEMDDKKLMDLFRLSLPD